MENKLYLWIFVAALILVQSLSVIFLWSLDTFSQVGESLFALFLSVDLVSFALLSYVYRKRRSQEIVSGTVVLFGCAVILALILGIAIT